MRSALSSSSFRSPAFISGCHRINYFCFTSAHGRLSAPRAQSKIDLLMPSRRDFPWNKFILSLLRAMDENRAVKIRLITQRPGRRINAKRMQAAL
jgi:hypothetical protein